MRDAKTKSRIKIRIRTPSIFKRVQKSSHLRKAIANVFLLSATGVCILFISFLGKIPFSVELREGDVCIADIYAPFDFKYEGGINREKTDQARAKAASLTLNVYTLDVKKLNDAIIRFNLFFDNTAALKKSQLNLDGRVSGEFRNSTGIEISPADLNTIVSYGDQEKLRQVSIWAINEVFSKPIIAETDSQKLAPGDIKNITVKSEADKSGKTVNVADILLPDSAKQAFGSYINKNLDASRSLKKALSDALDAAIGANLTYNEKETNAIKKAAEESVRPIYYINEVKNGEIIISKGERVSAEALAKLSAIKSKASGIKNFPFLFSFTLILLLSFFVLAAYILIYEPKMLTDNVSIAFICALLFVIAALTKVIIVTPLPSYLIPAASVPMLFTLLIGNTAVFPLIVITSIIVSMMSGAGLNIFIVSFIGSAVGVFVVKRARRRSQLLKAGLYLGISNFICISSWGILNELEPAIFLTEGTWGIAAGIFASVITMTLLPMLEKGFKLISDIGLLELADLNHPLLKEMASKATGTYHHSLVVGNLAEAACDAIGANSLLARVGAYYHDIGKIAKAEYFSENQPVESATHEALTPHMSSLIITNHVKDGVDLARKYKLPQVIIAMIEQHHGTGLIYYFYQKALEKQQEEEAVKEEGFRYPGPKPQVKETAIVLLADSVEAASKTLGEPTPAKLEELVRRIINNKFIDRQLDECELTLCEIDTIARSFLPTLAGIYHARIKYPK